jgi:hypothetical protein
MDISAIGDKDFEVWMPFLDAEVLMRYVGLDELRAIQASATRKSLEGGAGLREELDHAEANRLLGRASVRGWQGFTLNGEEFSWSPENCDMLMARWTEFARFVGEGALDLVKLEEARQRESEKKSMLTSGQGGTTPG